MARTYYAAYRPYGLATLNTSAVRADVVHAFRRLTDRNDFVAADPEHRERLTRREAIAETSPRGRSGYNDDNYGINDMRHYMAPWSY